MWKKFCQFYFWLSGWKVTHRIDPTVVRKAVIIGAPHTSNWDYVWSIGALKIMGVPVRFLGKKELFRGPLGWLMRVTGGVAVDRSKRNSLVSQLAEMFEGKDQHHLLVPPEGTRGYAKKWKSGFYHIANEAQVPIALGFLDYEKKEAGIERVFDPTGNYDADLLEIQNYYRQFAPKYPERSTLFVGPDASSPSSSEPSMLGVEQKS